MTFKNSVVVKQATNNKDEAIENDCCISGSNSFQVCFKRDTPSHWVNSYHNDASITAPIQTAQNAHGCVIVLLGYYFLELCQNVSEKPSSAEPPSLGWSRLSVRRVLRIQSHWECQKQPTGLSTKSKQRLSKGNVPFHQMRLTLSTWEWKWLHLHQTLRGW